MRIELTPGTSSATAPQEPTYFTPVGCTEEVPVPSSSILIPALSVPQNSRGKTSKIVNAALISKASEGPAPLIRNGTKYTNTTPPKNRVMDSPTPTPKPRN